MNAIEEQVGGFAKICVGKQKTFFEQKLKDLREVNVVPLSDVFTKAQISRIKRLARPMKKECYRNAQRVCELFCGVNVKGYTVEYVEGYSTIFDGTFPIEHAWNKIGDKYVDVTFELALGLDVTKELYMSLGAFNLDTIRRVTLETKYYGDIYNHLLIKKLEL